MMSFKQHVSCLAFAVMGCSTAAAATEEQQTSSVLPNAMWEAAVAVVSIIVVVALAKYNNKNLSGRKRDKLGYEVTVGFACGPSPVVGSKTEDLRSAIAKTRTVVPKLSYEVAKEPEEKTRMSEALANYARKGDVENAQRVTRELENKFGNLSLAVYTSVITTCAKANEPEHAHKWLRRVSEVGLAPNVVCFNTVINAFAKGGNMIQALALTEEMKQAGVEYDTITYNTLIDAWTRAGDAHRAQMWMKRMLAAGVKPSVVSFGSVMRVCAQAGLTHDLEFWMNKAAELSIQLNMITFSAVINSFAKKDDFASASAWLVRMLDYGVAPAMQCFSGLLHTLLKNGDVGSAMALVDTMRAAKIEFDSVSFSSLVVRATSNGFYQAAQTWADQAADVGPKLSRAAELVLLGANLRVPVYKKLPVDAQTDSASQSFDTPVLGPSRAKERRACIGKKFAGIIKEFIPGKFGYIQCEKVHSVFRCDVFLSCQENPDHLCKGQRVTFTLRPDGQRGQPRATDVKVQQSS